MSPESSQGESRWTAPVKRPNQKGELITSQENVHTKIKEVPRLRHKLSLDQRQIALARLRSVESPDWILQTLFSFHALLWSPSRP